jgi:hypothetical protein
LTPYRLSCSCAVAVLQFPASTKRRPSHRSGTYTETDSLVVDSDAITNLQVAASCALNLPNLLLLHHLTKSSGKHPPSPARSYSCICTSG